MDRWLLCNRQRKTSGLFSDATRMLPGAHLDLSSCLSAFGHRSELEEVNPKFEKFLALFSRLTSLQSQSIHSNACQDMGEGSENGCESSPTFSVFISSC